MQNLYLIAEIAGSKVAIESALVESVVQIGDVIPVPRSHPSVAGLVALRSRVLTLIDCQYSVTGKNNPPTKGNLAVISEINGHFYGLLVDRVADVIVIDPGNVQSEIRLSSPWNEIATKVARVGTELLMIINPSILVGGQLELAA